MAFGKFAFLIKFRPFPHPFVVSIEGEKKLHLRIRFLAANKKSLSLIKTRLVEVVNLVERKKLQETLEPSNREVVASRVEDNV